MLVDFVVSLFVYSLFDPSSAAMQLVEDHVWVRDWGISYKMGIDGISLFLVLLTTLLGPIVILASWKDIKVRVKEFLICLLVPPSRDARRVCVPGSVPFLRILGNHADPHVPADRCLGQSARQALRGHQVRPLHYRGQPADACRHSGPLFHGGARQRRLHLRPA